MQQWIAMEWEGFAVLGNGMDENTGGTGMGGGTSLGGGEAEVLAGAGEGFGCGRCNYGRGLGWCDWAEDWRRQTLVAGGEQGEAHGWESSSG